MNRKRKSILLAMAAISAAAIIALLYHFNYLPHPRYSGQAFGIDTYVSTVDMDGDGIDDQSDILLSAREYVSQRPRYKSVYYGSGYPDDQYGVCTDVVAFGALGAGYDLTELVNEDIISHPDIYDIEIIDKNIDFRRVRNLNIYFNRNSLSLTTDINQIGQWQGGDIVVFSDHIGIVSDNRNRRGIPFVIHHAHPMQLFYEEDILESHDDIIGHYRLS